MKTQLSFTQNFRQCLKNHDYAFTYNETGDKLIEEALSYYYDGIPFVLKTTYYYSIHLVNSIHTANDLESKSPVVYPNPFTNQLSIRLNNTNSQAVFELFDAQGRKVLSTCVQNSETIDLTNIARGVYFYTLSKDNNLHRGKLIKK